MSVDRGVLRNLPSQLDRGLGVAGGGEPCRIIVRLLNKAVEVALLGGTVEWGNHGAIGAHVFDPAREARHRTYVVLRHDKDGTIRRVT